MTMTITVSALNGATKHFPAEAPGDDGRTIGWVRRLMLGVKKRLRGLRALVQEILGKLAPSGVIGQFSRRASRESTLRTGLHVAG